MSRFELDFSHLRKAVQPDQGRVPVKGNEHRLTRVAFDLFHMDNDAESLWQVQADDDGNEFLVRTYDVDQPDDIQSQSEWSVDSDKKQANLTISYRGVPIHRLAVADFGAATPAETRSLQKLVLSKLAADEEFVGNLIESLPATKREALAVSFPELTRQAEPFQHPLTPSQQEEADKHFQTLNHAERERIVPGWRQMPYHKVMASVYQTIQSQGALDEDQNVVVSETEPPEIHAGWHASAEDGDVVIARDGTLVVRLAASDFDAETEEFRQFVQTKLDAQDEDFLRSAIVHQAMCGSCGANDAEDDGEADDVARLMAKVNGGTVLKESDLKDLSDKSLEKLRVGLRGRIHEIGGAVKDEETRSGADAVMESSVKELEESLDAVNKACGKEQDADDPKYYASAELEQLLSTKWQKLTDQFKLKAREMRTTFEKAELNRIVGRWIYSGHGTGGQRAQGADAPKSKSPMLPKLEFDDPIGGLPPLDIQKEYGITPTKTPASMPTPKQKPKQPWKPKLPAWMKA